jgi:hypothetical protein
MTSEAAIKPTVIREVKHKSHMWISHYSETEFVYQCKFYLCT